MVINKLCAHIHFMNKFYHFLVIVHDYTFGWLLLPVVHHINTHAFIHSNFKARVKLFFSNFITTFEPHSLQICFFPFFLHYFIHKKTIEKCIFFYYWFSLESPKTFIDHWWTYDNEKLTVYLYWCYVVFTICFVSQWYGLGWVDGRNAIAYLGGGKEKESSHGMKNTLVRQISTTFKTFFIFWSLMMPNHLYEERARVKITNYTNLILN